MRSQPWRATWVAGAARENEADRRGTIALGFSRCTRKGAGKGVLTDVRSISNYVTVLQLLAVEFIEH